jgi:hypothetical protein
MPSWRIGTVKWQSKQRFRHSRGNAADGLSAAAGHWLTPVMCRHRLQATFEPHKSCSPPDSEKVRLYYEDLIVEYLSTRDLAR